MAEAQRDGSRPRSAWGPGAEGSPRIWLGATMALKERDTGERGQSAHQLVLEGRVTGLRGGRLPLPVTRVLPLIRIEPEVGCRRPASIMRRVDLPQPLGPTSTTKRPGLMSIETSDNAITAAPVVRNTRPTPLIWIAPAREAGLSGVMFANGCIAFPPIGSVR